MNVVAVTLENVVGTPKPVVARSSARSVRSFKETLESAPGVVADSTGRASQIDRHTVRRGDTLWRICEDRLRASGKAASPPDVLGAVNRVARANGLADPDVIRVGRELDLSTVEGAATSGSAGIPSAVLEQPATAAKIVPLPEELAELVETYPAPPLVPRLSPVTSSDLGAPAMRSTAQYQVQDATAHMQSLLDQGSAMAALSRIESPWKGLLEDGPMRLTSGFGMRKDPFTGRPQHHDGIDIAAPLGTPIHPYKEGRVVVSGWEGGYGRVVAIQHDDGTETRYGHTSKNLVRVGERVTPDKAIALVGSTGRSTGPHLHFELRENGRAIDPVPHLVGKPTRLATTAYK